MPEIVEYAKLKRQLEGAWKGRKILLFSAPKASPNPTKYYQGSWPEFTKAVLWPTIHSLTRHGKSLGVLFDQQPYYWHIHLSSTGWWMPGNQLAQQSCQTDPIHDNFLHSINEKNIRVKMHLSDGQTWFYHDPRTWGKWTLRQLSDPEQHGPDWLENSRDATTRLYGHKGKRTVKEVLTDQRLAAGLGNYLACEICFLARIHPHRRWHTLYQAEKDDLVGAIITMLRDSMASDSHSHWNVFDKKGEPCPRHPHSQIEYAKDGATAKRGSYFCAECQVLHDPISPDDPRPCQTE